MSARREELTWVSLCCNSTENGASLGRVWAVHVDDDGDTIELSSHVVSNREDDVCYPSVSTHTDANRGVVLWVKIGHLIVPVAGYRSWFGNWCWDGILVKRRDARRLVRYLLSTRKWDCDCYPLDSDLLPREMREGAVA